MNAIALNPLFGPLIRHGLRNLQDAAFAAGVGCDVLAAREGVDRGDVDDFARAVGGEEVLGEFLAGDEDGFEVDVDDGVDV